MKLKTLTLWGSLLMLIGMTTCGEKATPAPITTTGLAGITLVPYANSEN